MESLPKALLVLSPPQAADVDEPVDVLAGSRRRIAAPVLPDRLNEPPRASAGLICPAQMAAGGGLPAHVPRVIVGRSGRLLLQAGGRLLVAAEEEQDAGKKVVVVARVARVEPLGEFDGWRA